METDGDRGRVGVANLEVDVAHCRIEGARTGIGNGRRFGGTLPGGGNGTRVLPGGGPGTRSTRPDVNITMRPMPF